MNTITQIENALNRIDQAAFQSLINHLLHLKGNKFIGAPGSVVGKNKTSKGSPDAFFLNGDKYVFIECTTQARVGNSKSLFGKLAKDIDHCFNEKQTKIPIEKIEKIILAFTETISAEECESLLKQVKSKNSNTNLEILNIQNLPMLLHDIPKLLEEHLQIQVVKGDIYTLEEFLVKTTKGIQPHLRNEFIARDEEYQSCLKSFENYDILFLTGGQGVGKSKLAVHILDEFSKNDYYPIVIQSSGVSLWDDYAHLFHAGKKHIILFDDANKALSNLEYLLNKIDSAQTFSVKLVITSREYVKQQVEKALSNHRYKEINVPDLRDEDIEKIIISVLPNLRSHHAIKDKIIELAKGNARMALMATHSMKPGSETNFLNSPVLLYERYFEKLSEEIGIFDKPIILQSLAVVSFFGVLERENQELKVVLKDEFNIEWNDLWSSILELHQHEIIDVYQGEIVKISDQILSTYAFYKCFIHQQNSVIDYSRWISIFIKRFPDRIRTTLIEVNNTFGYDHIKILTAPHLNLLLKMYDESEELLYDFYKVFWYYKSRECLLFIKSWIEKLPTEGQEGQFNFTFVHNDHGRAPKYFELLIRFWNHSAEWVRASLELTLTLVSKQPSRIPVTLKFLHDHFKYTIDDVETGYLRQTILLDVLFHKNLSEAKTQISNGIFTNIAKIFLGWRYTEFGPLKGSAFTMRNFNLFKSDALMHFRRRILEKVIELYDPKNIQTMDILKQIQYPGGDIDNSIYAEEVDIYKRLIAEKLEDDRLSDCKFVERISERITKAGQNYPPSWDLFIQSDIRKLSKLFKPCWETRNDKTIEECENEKRKEVENFVNKNDWDKIEEFLLKIDNLNSQEDQRHEWHLQSVISDVYISLIQKDKQYFEKALRLFFSRRVNFSLKVIVFEIPMRDNLMSGMEILKILDDYEFGSKPFWKSALINFLPKNEVNASWLEILFEIFTDTENDLHLISFKNYEKFGLVFERYKSSHDEMRDHNIITYLTKLISSSPRKNKWDFGFHFFTECSSYFENHTDLLENIYWSLSSIDQNFDYDGKELEAVMNLNRNFINDGLKSGKLGLEFSSSLRLENINTNVIWDYPEYEEIVENIIATILEKATYLSLVEGDIESLFKFREPKQDNIQKSKHLLLKLSIKNVQNPSMISVLSEIVYDNYREWFIEYFKELILANKNIELVESISFGNGSSWTGSRVPVIQAKMEFYQDIRKMILTLPDLLDYSPHLDFFEAKIERKKKEIIDEQKSDFRREFH